jgi:hypothetical protein
VKSHIKIYMLAILPNPQSTPTRCFVGGTGWGDRFSCGSLKNFVNGQLTLNPQPTAFKDRVCQISKNVLLQFVC